MHCYLNVHAAGSDSFGILATDSLLLNYTAICWLTLLVLMALNGEGYCYAAIKLSCYLQVCATIFDGFGMGGTAMQLLNYTDVCRFTLLVLMALVGGLLLCRYLILVLF